MVREMRRKNQALDMQECLRILQSGENGVLALQGDGEYPYAVPLNYVYKDGRLYFHGATQGHKMDVLRACDRVSFCVIDADQVDAQARTTLYRSVIAFGRMRILEDEAQKKGALTLLAQRFCPDAPEKNEEEIQAASHRTAILEMQIERLTGKEAQRLARARRESRG